MPSGTEEIIFPIVTSLDDDWERFLKKNKINNPEEFLDAVDLPQSALTSIQIGICTACNFDCPMCFNHFNKEYDYYSNRWLSFDEFKEIIDTNAPINDLTFAVSGEPFLHPDIFKMLEYAKDHVKTFSFSTNAALLTPESIEQLSQYPINLICLSADGADKETYETFRKNGKFEAFCKISKMLGQRFGDKVILAATVFKENKESLMKMPALLKKTGIKKMLVFKLFEHPGAHEKGVHKLESDEMAEFMVDLIAESEKHKIQVGWDTRAVNKKIAKFINNKTNGCHASDFTVFNNHCSIPFHVILIDSEGNYNFCCALEPIPAESLTTPASELYNSDEIKKMRVMNILRRFPGVCKKYCGKIDDSSIDANIETLKKLIKKETFETMNWEPVKDFSSVGKTLIAPCGTKTLDLLSSGLKGKFDIVAIIDQQFKTMKIDNGNIPLLGYESVKDLDYDTVIVTSGAYWRDILFWFVENDPEWMNRQFLRTDNIKNRIELLVH